MISFISIVWVAIIDTTRKTRTAFRTWQMSFRRCRWNLLLQEYIAWKNKNVYISACSISMTVCFYNHWAHEKFACVLLLASKIMAIGIIPDKHLQFMFISCIHMEYSNGNSVFMTNRLFQFLRLKFLEADKSGGIRCELFEKYKYLL